MPITLLEALSRFFGDQNKTLQFSAKPGQLFNGEAQITVQYRCLSPNECQIYGFDPLTEGRRLYCEIKFFKDGFGYDGIVTSNAAGDWKATLIQSVIPDTWLESSIFSVNPNPDEVCRKIEQFISSEILKK